MSVRRPPADHASTNRGGDGDLDTVPLLMSEPSAPSKSLAVSVAGRLASLDALRGATVMMMILVDNVGSAFPEIDHSPWNGITLADTVMPSFDFIVGVSVVIALRRFKQGDRRAGLKTVLVRFLKMFLLGVATQGGIALFQWDLATIRIMGILQRVAVCYIVTALVELYSPPAAPSADLGSPGWVRLHMSVGSRARFHWLTAFALVSAWCAVMYGLDVPPSFGERCGKGVLTPACNAQRVVDAAVLSVSHMYFPTNGGSFDDRDVTYQRLPECSSCSPGKCPAPDEVRKGNLAGLWIAGHKFVTSVVAVSKWFATGWLIFGTGWNVTAPWCESAPFDPEGLVSSLTATVASLLGAHVGGALLLLPTPNHRLAHLSVFALLSFIIGIPLHTSGILPLNTDLYTPSFLLVTNGISCTVLIFCYLTLDFGEYAARKLAVRFLSPCTWMGRNAITVYLLAEGGVTQWILGVIYVTHKGRTYSLASLCYPGEFWGGNDSDGARPLHPSRSLAVLFWTLGYIAVWSVVAWWMDRRRLYIKI